MRHRNQISYFVVVLIVLTAFLCRLAYYFKYPVQWRDAYAYKSISDVWDNTKHYPLFQDDEELNYVPPFPLFIFNKLSLIFNSSYFISGVAVEIVLGSFLVFIIWKGCMLLHLGVISSIMISLIACFHHTLLDFSTQVTRDNLYLFFSAIALLHFLNIIYTRSFFHSICFGLFSALSFLCRYEAIELLLLLFVFTWKIYRYKSNYFFSCFIASATFFFAVFTINYMICPDYSQFINLFQKIQLLFSHA